jgi:cell volume regulation protein A
MEYVNLTFLVAGLLVFLSAVAGLFSSRAGFSFLLVFLVGGMLAGEDGPGGIVFDDFGLAFWVGNAALAVILLDGGLRTEYATFRTGLRPALWLATAGVLISAVITGAATTALLSIDWRLGLLIGAIVGSTDAAAVFSLIRTSGVRLTERLAATLEIESGLNDPMAVFLTMALIALAVVPGAGSPNALIVMLLQQAGWGTVFGVAGGLGTAALLNRLPLKREHRADPAQPASGGLLALVLLAAGLAVFGAAGALGGSGFLAVYLCGLLIARRAGPMVAGALPAMDGYAWLAQAGMFLLLGLLVTPSQVLPIVPAGLAVAAVLMFVARPVAVALCLVPLRYTGREIAYVSWVGLRGAVPIVLAVFPVIAEVPGAHRIFDVTFVVVLISLLLQGTTIGWAARRFGVALPDEQDERATRQVFGDFEFEGSTEPAALCEFYALPPPPPQAGATLDAWLERAIDRPPVVGDVVAHGNAEFSVRTMEGARIVRVGLRLFG